MSKLKPHLIPNRRWNSEKENIKTENRWMEATRAKWLRHLARVASIQRFDIPEHDFHWNRITEIPNA